MPSGLGFWLDTRTGKLHRVTTHNDWLLVAENQDKIGLSEEDRIVLSRLDPQKEIDEIRMVGVMRGLVRFRDYFNRLSIQFYCEPFDAREFLEQAVSVIGSVTNDPNPYLTIQNLYDDSVARLELKELEQLLATENKVLVSVEPIQYNIELRQKMASLYFAAAMITR